VDARSDAIEFAEPEAVNSFWSSGYEVTLLTEPTLSDVTSIPSSAMNTEMFDRLFDRWRAWASTTDRSEDGWESDFPEWPDLIAAAGAAKIKVVVA